MKVDGCVTSLIAGQWRAGRAAIALALLGAGLAAAQAPRPRIAGKIDDSVRAALSGSVPPLARPEYDQGEAPASTQMDHVRLIFSRSAQEEAALDSSLEELRDSSSPNYHRWLTPEEFGARYGIAPADTDAIRSWLEDQGFSDITVPKGRMSIAFSGSVAALEQTFQTSIHSFRIGEMEFLANVTNPSIPAALATVVTGIVDLNTVRPSSDFVPGDRARMNTLSGRFELNRDDHSEYTSVRNGDSLLFVTPADAATQYNTPNKELNANFTSGASYDGAGVSIGIIGNSGLESSATTPIVNWRKLFLPSNYKFDFSITNVGGVTSRNSIDEAFLDLETAGGIAPGAALHFYTSYPDILPAISEALDDNTVDILNVSYGKCEKNAGNSDNQTILEDWKQAAAQGIAVVVSAGDTGSARCDPNGINEANDGLAVNYYGSTQYNVAVGGTDTWGLVNNFSEYVEPASSDAAKVYYRTLMKPIPESTWDNSQDSPSAVPGPISAAVMYTATIGAGGGGASSCTTQTSSGACVSGNPKPSWQTGPGVPPDRVRDLPDVALLSGNGYDNAEWPVCSTDLGSCAVETGGYISFTGAGGTSFAAPAFAGMLALVEQKTGSRIGAEAPSELYTLNRFFGSRIFNDITLGNNAPPCYAPTAVIPSPDCVKNKAGYYFESGYNAGPGYDLASGLGSVNATNLVEFWGAAAPQPAAVAVKPQSASVFRGDSLAVTVTVTGKSGTPTGTVQLAGGGFASKAKALSGGKVAFDIPANLLAAGTDTLTAIYSGDSKFGGATSSAKVTVTQLTPTVKVTAAMSSTSIGESLKVAVQVSATVGTPAGRVTLSSGSYASAATALSSGKAQITIPAGKLAVGTDTLTAVYEGSADYKEASGHASIKVTQ